ncbi:MAG: DUF4194 domain-containing protein [Bacteroidota bacterium]
MNDLENKLEPYSRAIVSLLKSPVERSQKKTWETVISYQKEIQDYIVRMGLELIVKRDEGFAFVTQFEDSEGNTTGMIQRRQVGFEVSIILVVLRQMLEEFDSNPTHFQASEKFVKDDEIKEELTLFLTEKYDKVKLMKDFEKHINKVVDLGYLKAVKTTNQETTYQIHRIIKEKVTLDILEDFRKKLQTYVESL